MGVALDSLGGIIVFFTVIFATLERDNITTGTAGLSISFAMQVRSMCAFQCYCTLHCNNMSTICVTKTKYVYET